MTGYEWDEASHRQRLFAFGALLAGGSSGRMSDAQFLQLFEEATLPFAEWHHRAQLKVAYLYLRKYPFARAAERMQAGIRKYNAANAVPDDSACGFHQTATLAWLHLLEAILAQYGPEPTADEFLALHPEVGTPELLRLFYSSDRLTSPEARAHFVEPDLAPLPRWPAATAAPQKLPLEAEGGLRLRPVTLHDAGEICAAVLESLPEISPWMDWCHCGYDFAAARRWCSAQTLAWVRDEEYAFVIEGEGKEVAGVCGLNDFHRMNAHANLGYWVRTRFTRKGFASRAARRVAQYGFEVLGLNRVEIVAAVENVASQRAAQKAGAIREALLRERLMIDDRPHDAVLFSLTRADFPELNRERE